VRYVVDRIEGEIAVCLGMSDDGDLEIRAGDLPPGTKEGDVIAAGNGTFVIDGAETAKRRADLTERMNRLFQK